MSSRDPTPPIQAVAKLLRHREPSAPLRSLTLVFHNLLNSEPDYSEWDSTFGTSKSQGEFHILCNEIDSILSNEPHDSEAIATSLTIKSLNALSTRTANYVASALEARFPKLHRRGSLKIDLSIDCMSIGIVMARLRACLPHSTQQFLRTQALLMNHTTMVGASSYLPVVNSSPERGSTSCTATHPKQKLSYGTYEQGLSCSKSRQTRP